MPSGRQIIVPKSWFKFTAVGYEDCYGFGTLDDALSLSTVFASEDLPGSWTPYLIAPERIGDLDLANKADAFDIAGELHKRDPWRYRRHVR